MLPQQSIKATDGFRFAGQVLSSPHREVQQAAPLETDVPKEWIRSYMAFRLKYAEARIEEGVTVQTLLKEFQQIMRTISKNTGTAWLPKDKTAMKQVSYQQADIEVFTDWYLKSSSKA